MNFTNGSRPDTPRDLWSRWCHCVEHVEAGANLQQRLDLTFKSPTYREAHRDLDFLADEGVIDPEDRELFWYAETAEEIWEGIREWHRLNRTPLPLS